MHSQTDIVFIQGFKVFATIGIYDWEQAITQPLIFDVEMAACQKEAGTKDDLALAIDYKAVCERITQICATHKVALLERLAQLVADMILTEFQPKSVMVTLHKPTAIRNAQSVGVKIFRQRPDSSSQ